MVSNTISRLIAATALTVSALGTTAHAQPLSPEVHTAQGPVRGEPRDQSGIISFKGIPYAAAPVGDLRWRAPQKVAKWTDVKDAQKFGNRCLSALEHDPVPGPPRSEDCLTLNVWTGATHVEEKRPVMVWLHGGGFQFGSSAEPTIGGVPFAKKGVVLVTINYRLGVFGFMAHPELDAEGPSGNYGLQDQIAALKWVKENIARFGGDPHNVTLFGESAGAMSIGILMASPLADGLFQKAIGQSGAFWDGKNGPVESFDESRARGLAYAKKLGGKSITEMRAMPAQALNDAALWNFTMNPMVTVFSPNVDKYVVPEFPAVRYTKGAHMKIPLLAGWNAAEYYPFQAFSLPHASAPEFRSAAEKMFGTERLPEFLKLYPASTDAEANKSANMLTSDLVIAEQTWQWLELQRKRGIASVFGYEFTYTSPYTPVASHITDVPFVFGSLVPQFVLQSRTPAAEPDRKMSDTMMSYWTNFARQSDPNGAGLPIWPRFDQNGLIQNLGTTVAAQQNASAERFHFIGSYRVKGQLPIRWRKDVP